MTMGPAVVWIIEAVSSDSSTIRIKIDLSSRRECCGNHYAHYGHEEELYGGSMFSFVQHKN